MLKNEPAHFTEKVMRDTDPVHTCVDFVSVCVCVEWKVESVKKQLLIVKNR
jgi:hypothetical protein